MNPQNQSTAPRAVPPAVNGWQPEYLDAEYARFKADPGSMPADLAAFFRGFDLALAGSTGTPAGGGAASAGGGLDRVVAAFRALGHLAAKIDPLGREPAPVAELEPGGLGLGAGELDQVVATTLIPGRSSASVREVIAHLRACYAGAIGAEFMHIPCERERAWFIERFESAPPAVSNAEREQLLAHLTAAEVFDKFLGKRYQGKKRFSLEGGESLIPWLKVFTQRVGELGAEEVIIGMPHRGRLSVLRNYLGKDLQRVFTEFEDSWISGEGQTGGDVKYHRGYSGDQALPDGRRVHLSMLNNPSHLESVNAVVMGKCRAKQERVGDASCERIVSLLMHGDAALAGQGVVAEGLTLSNLAGYRVGGTVHAVINNLVGFTTDPEDSRSTRYCTDIAKMVNAPVLHVNGDEPEAVARAARLAAEYRHAFKKDIFVDLVCFRRYGHNEQDEPGYTQPQLYALVREHPGTPETYRRRLVASGAVSAEAAQAMIDAAQGELDAAQSAARAKPVNPVPEPGGGEWKGFHGRYTFESPATAVSPAVLGEVCAALGRVPDGFRVHPKLKGLLAARAALPTTKKLSHADAELIAIGTLAAQGVPVRLSGQDCRRGTFTQRHAVLRDEQTGERYTSVNHVRPGQAARLDVYDSPLSEYSVLGFEYGYSRGAPRTLVMWEAQFGDFCNTAQVMIDQWMAASEIKWTRWAGLVLLLPHGYEGQGPEHSSARLERFLLLCADDNMEVVYPSTGAQLFHLLRRQALRDIRKPLVVMTPKKFLRAETSTADELTSGQFRHVIDDPALEGSSATGVRRVAYCTGKIYHELAERREAIGKRDVALVRLEQLYPFHAKTVREIDARYPAGAERVWVQEEPRNAGAYLYAADIFRERLGINVGYIGRPASATPATGSEHTHKQQQEAILSGAVGPAKAAGEAHGAKAQPAGTH